jgi:hypothetical protein
MADGQRIPKKPHSPVLFYLLYTYGFLQFFSAISNVTTPKYFHSLLDLRGVPKWKLIPIGLFDMCLMVSGVSMLSFSILIYLTYVLTTCRSLELIRLLNTGPT